MDKSRMHTAWAGVGLTLALTVGSPAYADDVELLLSNPAASNAAKPNILFILDSSGSMKSIETSQEPFNGANEYTSGPCDRDYYYWTTTNSTPSCDSDNEQKIKKSAFVCAQGITQAAAAGSYTDTMSQYRRSNGKWKWRTLRSGWESAIVECKEDSGVHGGGTAGDVYARIGTNNPKFTSSKTREVAWGSSPTHKIYTVYDGNYLNWFYDPPTTSMSRNAIVKEVTKNVLGSINNANVGFMRFNGNDGGPVTHAVKDLDSNRAEAVAIVDALPNTGNTPLSETMYEAARYWRGMTRDYGPLSMTDPDALVTGNNDRYKNPIDFACSKNFTVLLTDGKPTWDTGVYDDVPKLPNYATAMGRSKCSGDNVNGACLDDVAEYLSKEDINSKVPGEQTVTTYTIGFKVDLDILKTTAENSGGEYYLAKDVKTLTKALTDIVTNIFDRDISFTAPAVAVNAFNRTQHLNDLYVSVFRAKDNHHWPGNLKKYRIRKGVVTDSNNNAAVDPKTGYFADSSKSYWTEGTDPDGPNVNAGGALSKLPDPSLRRIFTNNVSYKLTLDADNRIAAGSEGSFSLADFGVSGAAGDPDLPSIMAWARGVDVKDEVPNSNVRRAMGDTLHSQPASIVYGGSAATGNLDIVVYTATNDGYLHAIDANTGIELWSFIPKELLVNMGDLYHDNNINYKHYGIDGDLVPIVADRNHNGTIEPGVDLVYLVFGLRRGGSSYYALDVTDKNNPEVKWIKTYPEFGQTWSPPVVAKVQTSAAEATSPDEAVLVIGAGYDTAHDQPSHPASNDNEGAGIFMLDLKTGAEVWRAGRDPGADLPLDMMKRSIPTRIRVLDMSGDGYADRMYASDLGGQIWRFDITNGANARDLVEGGVIARLGGEGLAATPSIAETRRFYTTPDVSMFHDHKHDQRYLSISIGSGYRAHPLDERNEDRFYSIRDAHVFNPLSEMQYSTYPIVNDSQLVEVQGKLNVTLKLGDPGWKFTLPPGEKILSDSQTFDDSVYFVSFQPKVSSENPCQAGLSTNRLYRVNVVNGDPVVDTSILDPNDAAAADAARVTELDQGGIAPKPTFLFPSPDDPDNCVGEECTPPPIGCVGVECFDPGFPNNPVRTLWAQDGVQ